MAAPSYTLRASNGTSSSTASLSIPRYSDSSALHVLVIQTSSSTETDVNDMVTTPSGWTEQAYLWETGRYQSLHIYTNYGNTTTTNATWTCRNLSNWSYHYYTVDADSIVLGSGVIGTSTPASESLATEVDRLNLWAAAYDYSGMTSVWVADIVVAGDSTGIDLDFENNGYASLAVCIKPDSVASDGTYSNTGGYGGNTRNFSFLPFNIYSSGPSFTRDGVAGSSIGGVDGVSVGSLSTVDGVS